MRLPILAAAFLLAAAAPADKKPKGPAITPSSPEAMLVLKAPRFPVEYVVGISSYDPVERQLKSGISGGWADMEVKRLKAGRNEVDYIVRKVKPGTYVLRDVTQQTAWGICFHAQSYQFQVKPGQVLYLGDFDGKSAVMELQTRVVQSGQLTASQGTVHHYFDAIPVPPLAPVTEAALAEAQAFLAASLPQTTSKVQAAKLSRATFGTGKDLFGLQRICGGWHKKKGKPLPDEPAASSE